MFKAFIHPAPMKRHNKHTVSATISATVVLPGSEPPFREPGLYLDIRLGDGRTQLLHIPADQMKELRLSAVALATAAQQ